MRKTLLTAACLFVATQAAAVTLNVNRMEFWDASSPRLYADYTDPDVQGFVNFTAGTGALTNTVPFFGQPWRADAQETFVGPGTFSWSGYALPTTVKTGTIYAFYDYEFTLAAGDIAVGFFFDWSVNLDIPVLTVFHDNGDGTWDAYDQPWTDYYGTAGTGMQTSPFPGQWPAFSGVTNLPPEIEVDPAVVVNWPLDTPYVDPEVRATDNEDGDLGVVVGDTSGVIVGSVGDYLVAYDGSGVLDSAGQPADSVNRPVHVYDPDADDVTPPVIIVTGDPLVVAPKSTFDRAAALVGVNVTDDRDAGLISDVVISGDTVDTSIPAGEFIKDETYNICYDVEDLTGNPALQVCRDIHVVDLVKPSLKLIGSAGISLPVGQTFSEHDQGAYCLDAVDGVLQATIVGTSGQVDTRFVTLPGDEPQVVQYSCEDLSGNLATVVEREVYVVDCAVEGIVINNFTMYTETGGIVGGSNSVNFTWTPDPADPTKPLLLDGSTIVDGIEPDENSNARVGTNCKFFGFPWFADPVWLYGEGTYTFDACPAGDETNNYGASTDGSSYCTPGAASNMITLTVGQNQIGAHMMFEWSTAKKIDMLQLWDLNVDADGVSHGSTAKGAMTKNCGGSSPNQVWDLASMDLGDDPGHIPGAGFVDGPFVGFSGNLNMMWVGGGLPQDEPVLEIQNATSPVRVLPGTLTFNCPTANAKDRVDGILCDDVATVGCDLVGKHALTDTGGAKPGAYTITYSVVDRDSPANKVSKELLVIVFGAKDDVPVADGDTLPLGANPLVVFGDTVNHPVIILNPELDADGNVIGGTHNKTTLNVNLGEECVDPGFEAVDMQDGALTVADMTSDFDTAVNCTKPGRYTITYTVTDKGGNPVVLGNLNALADPPPLVTTTTRDFNVNAVPTADQQVPAEQSDNADVGGGCSVANGSMNPLQRADLLLLGGFLAALGMRRVKRSDV